MANSVLRQIRLFAYFVIGVLLSAVSVMSYAAGGIIGYCATSSFTSCKANADDLIVSQCGVTTNKTIFGSVSSMGCNSSYCVQTTTYKIDKQGLTSTSDDCFATVPAYYCPDGKNWNGASCVVANPCADKSGMYYNNGQYSKSNLAGGDGAFSGPTTTSSQTPATFCQDGCQMATLNLEGGAAGGTWYGKGNPTYTGSSCSASDGVGTTKPPTTPEYDCVKAGKGFGYFNGNVVCTDINNTSSKTSNTKTTTNPDGTKQDVKTDSSVKCDGTVCITTITTTTTTYDSSGTTTGTTTKTDSSSKPDPSATGNGTKGDSTFCAQNPDSPMCKTGSFGASCTSEPSCDGDPVQCATARATWKTRCALEPTQDVMTAGQNVLNGDQAATDALKKTSVAMPTIDTAGGGSSGSCPADKVVNIYGDQNLTLKLSALCGAADLMKIALLAMASFTAAMIIVGGIK